MIFIDFSWSFNLLQRGENCSELIVPVRGQKVTQLDVLNMPWMCGCCNGVTYLYVYMNVYVQDTADRRQEQQLRPHKTSGLGASEPSDAFAADTVDILVWRPLSPQMPSWPMF